MSDGTKRGARRVLAGVVCAVAKDGKTVAVKVERRTPHLRFQKAVGFSKKYQAHNAKECTVGDVVQIQESRPYSKNVRFTLLKVLERAVIV